jgi:hypothetical protein
MKLLLNIISYSAQNQLTSRPTNRKEKQVKNTPTPWSTRPLKSGFAIVAIVNDEAFARRVVATVNDCEAISNEALEKGAVKDLLASMKILLEGIKFREWDSMPEYKIAYEELHKATKK